MAGTYAFASVDELSAAIKGGLDPSLEELAETLLDQAGLVIRRNADIGDADQELLDVCKMVSINMVKRAINADASGMYGVSQADAQMGPFQQSLHWANPSGDLYITPKELDWLGAGGDWVDSIPAKIEGYYGSNS